MMTKGIAISFIAGWYANKLYHLAFGHYMNWKFNRDYRLADERFTGCTHQRIKQIDTGTDQYGNRVFSDKCLDCWGLRTPIISNEWHPNCAKP
jgi:hypothetical protein